MADGHPSRTRCTTWPSDQPVLEEFTVLARQSFSDARRDARRWRLLDEALEVVVPVDADPRHVGKSIIDDALAMAGRTEIPTIADGLRAFVEGHLLDAIEAHLDAEAADRFEESIDLI